MGSPAEFPTGRLLQLRETQRIGFRSRGPDEQRHLQGELLRQVIGRDDVGPARAGRPHACRGVRAPPDAGVLGLSAGLEFASFHLRYN